MKRFWSCQEKPVGAALRALLWVKVGGSNPPGPTTILIMVFAFVLGWKAEPPPSP